MLYAATVMRMINLRSFLDWKYLISLFFTIAVPLWIWYADLTAHSLHFRLVSQTSLQPQEKTALSDLKVTVDGEVIEIPYLSVIDLVNDGSKPIPAADFESQLELRLAEGASIVRARITTTSPKDVEAELVFDKQSVRIKPLLLNPKDSVTVAIVSSGALPKLSTRARISGVASVPLIDETQNRSPRAGTWFALCVGVGLVTAFMIVNDGVFNKSGIHLRPRASLLVALFTVVGGSRFMIYALDNMGVSNSVLVLYFLLAAILGTAAAVLVNRPLAKKTP